MKRWAKVEGAFSGWIGAEEFLTREDRRFLAELLFTHLYDITYPSQKELEESGFPRRHPNWARIVLDLLNEEKLRKATKNHEEFSMSVAKDMLRWFLSMNIRFLAHHDFQREESHFRHVSNHLQDLPAEAFIQRIEELIRDFPERESQWKFYKQAFERENLNRTNSLSTNQLVLREKFLAEWGQEFSERKTETEQHFLEGKWEGYLGDLSEKAERLEEIEDLIDPFAQFLGSAWNNSLGNWREIDWSQLRAIANQLKSDQQLHELLEWLGRWRSNEKARDLKRRKEPLPRNHWHPNPFGKSEIVGITQSNHLESVLPSEIALLSTEETEIIFAQKYIEHKLLTFQYRSLDIEKREDPRSEKNDPSDSESHGPFILCIDTSGSMYGTPEQVAKGLALAITELALKEKRACYLIAFSTGTKAIELTGMEQEFNKLLDFLKMSFHGSTDLHPALEEANRMLKEERFHNADVLVISDFLLPRLDRDLIWEIKKLKREQGVRYHSMFIGRNPDSNHIPLPIFTHHWIYDLNHPAVMRQWVEYMTVLGGRRIW